MTPESLFAPIVAILESDVHVLDDGEISFDQYMVPLLLDYAKAVLVAQESHSHLDVVR